MSDLTAIGTHCEEPNCSRLDFLPFQCADCRRTFCLDHRQRISHACSAPGPPPKLRHDPTSIPEFHPCAAEGCLQKEHVAIECPECRGNYCFAHRHGEDHRCSSKTSQNSLAVSAPAHPEFHLSPTLIAPVGPPKPRKAPTAMALKLNAMKLKMNAVGESGVMEEHRWFLEVFFLDDGGGGKSVYVADDWSFGRACASIKRVLRVDARHENARLRDVLHMDADVSPESLVKDVIPNGGSLQFVSL
ncbi:putative AN1-type zinc finger protein 1 [Hypsibius exemplaris]|uniref:AN1-type zinc finger protein 1 n=1 Tax=Hypsibius exemplaris TaxID=2072580 RepID=A0A1W0XC34_HYPEX|nr:putative AN1-type zinc finger protein 1 [Hypsibius exemplaris]